MALAEIFHISGTNGVTLWVGDCMMGEPLRLEDRLSTLSSIKKGLAMQDLFSYLG